MIVLAFPDYLIQAQRLAERLNVQLGEVNLHHFPDRESLVRLPTPLPEHIIICRSLDNPNDKLIELLFCAETARELGVRRITLVAPYLCYMRQDIANNPGEAVSQRIVGKQLAAWFDDVITVDPHLHRINALNEAIPLKNAIALNAAEQIGDFLGTKLDYAVLLGPDGESEQWVSRIAEKIGFDYMVAEKVREDDKHVKITLANNNFRDKPVVIIDDMVSTGRTIAEAASLLHASGVGEIYVAVTHPLFCGDAEQHIMETGVNTIWSTDSIDHTSSMIQLDKLLAEAVLNIIS